MISEGVAHSRAAAGAHIRGWIDRIGYFVEGDEDRRLEHAVGEGRTRLGVCGTPLHREIEGRARSILIQREPE